MIPFSPQMTDQTVEYCAAAHPVTSRGQVSPTYPPPGSGVTLPASVQPKTTMVVQPGGTVRSITSWNVWVTSDPSSLNIGNGIRRDDAFRWRGLFLVAKFVHVPVVSGDIAAWRAECELVK